MAKKPSILARLLKRAQKTKVVTFIVRQTPLTIAMWGALLVLAAYSAFFVLIALSSTVLFDGYAADGAFQALNPLRRMAAGEAIGADFNTFHGVGVPLLHLPFYFIFGQGLFASELSRQLLSPALFMMAIFMFFYTYQHSKKIALIATAILTAIAMAVMPLMVLPFTSMLGVRSVMTVLLAVIMLQQQKFSRPLSKKFRLGGISLYEVLVGLAMVACLLCGTEFGVAAIIGFFIAHILYKTDTAKWQTRLLSAARICGVFVVALVAFLTVVTSGQPLQPLLFAFGVIPNDQFWYFGIPPNVFLHLGNIVRIFLQDTNLLTYWLIAAAAIVTVLFVRRLPGQRVRVQTFIYMLLAGAMAMVSMLGYYHYSEAFALARMSLLVIGAGGLTLWLHYAGSTKVSANIQLHRRKWRVGTKHILMAAALVFVAWGVSQATTLGTSAVRDYDVTKILRKTKNYITGQDTNILGERWNQDLSILMPSIQADNNVEIADITEGDFEHGVHKKAGQVLVKAGDKQKFMRPGQVVYFNVAGRQIVGSSQNYKDDVTLVHLQNKQTKLAVAYDGAPHRLIVAEDFARDNTKLWSTYSTIFEVEMNIFNPNRQHADYIIHALGPELRTQYVEDFNAMQPKYVMTLKKSYFVYEEWLQNASWDFYSLVDKNYEAVKDGTMHVLWKRKDQPWVDPLAHNNNWQKLEVADNGQRITVPQIDFAKLPDVNAYVNETRIRDAERNRANGGPNEKPRLLLPRDEYIQAFGEQQVAMLEQAQPKFEGQGHNTSRGDDEEEVTDAHGNDGSQDSEDEDKKEDDKKNVNKNKAQGGDLLQPRRAVVLVKLQYETKNPLDKIPLLGKTARFFVQPNNLYSRTQVSLAPYKNEVVFPIIVSEFNDNSYLSLKNYSLLPAPASTKIISAEWQLLDTTAANLKVLTDWPGPSLKQP
jgi:hypothetical protein